MDPKKQVTITVGELMDLQALGSHAKRSELVSSICKRNEAILEDTRVWFMIPTPAVSPSGTPLNERTYLKAVWDTVITPTQNDNECLQPIEIRALRAVLRAVYEGMAE